MINKKCELFTKKPTSFLKSSVLKKYVKLTDILKISSGLERVFILSKKGFFIFNIIEAFPNNVKDHDNVFKGNQILSETLDFFYPKESQFVVLYGKIKSKDSKMCIVIFDFIQNLILNTIFLPSNYLGKKINSICGKVNQDRVISYIVLSFKDKILFYKAPFVDEKIQPWYIHRIDDTASIRLLEFGKISTNPYKDPTQDVLYLITSTPNRMRLRVFLIDDNGTDYSLPQEHLKIIIRKEFDFNPEKCILLDSDKICSGYIDQDKSYINVKTFYINKTENNLEIKEKKTLKASLRSKFTSIHGFNHYILTLNEDNSICIYDYEYIADLTKDDYMKKQAQAQRIQQPLEISNFKHSFEIHEEFSDISNPSPMICVFNNQSNSDIRIKFVFQHILRGFLVLYENEYLEELCEDQPSDIITKLVSSNIYFEYAKQQALLFSMSPDEIADIEWKQANFIFNDQSLDETTRVECAMDHFVKTIGYKSPSSVIQLYMNYKEETLIRYLWGNDKDPSIIMNPKTSSIEYLNLLISICVNLYLEIKKRLEIDDTQECLPLKILNNLAEDEKFKVCWSSLIDAFLAMGISEKAIELAEQTNNHERVLKLLFDTKSEKDKINCIVKEIFSEKIRKDDTMKYLNQYARELFYINDSDFLYEFIIKIADFTLSLLKENNEKYIQEICLLFVPQSLAVLPKGLSTKVEKNDSAPFFINENFDMLNHVLNESISQDEITDVTRMSILFFNLYQNLKKQMKNENQEIDSNILNNAYIQHLIILCRNKFMMKGQNLNFDSNEYYVKLKEALENDKYDIDVTILSIVDLPEPMIKFEMLKYICLKHEKYASNLIHLVSILPRNLIDDKISSAIVTLCEKFGKNNPNLYIEAIAELMQHERCIETIKDLLACSTNSIPLPDIITYILERSKESSEERNINLGLIKKYVVDWMEFMKKYEEELLNEVKLNEEKLKNVHSEVYSLKEMKEIRDEYDNMIKHTMNTQTSNPNPESVPNLVPQRPFSLIHISNDPSFNNDRKHGTALPPSLLEDIEKGVLINGLDKVDPNEKKKFSADAVNKIAQFDQMYEYLNQ